MAFTHRSSSRSCPGLAASAQRRTSTGLKARTVLSPLQVLTRLNLAAPIVPPSEQPACSTNSTGANSNSRGSTDLVSCKKGSRANNGNVKRVRSQVVSATTAPVMEVCRSSGDTAGTATTQDRSPAMADNGPSGPVSPDDCDLGACWGPHKLGQALRQIQAETVKKAAAKPNYLSATEAHNRRIVSDRNTKAPRTAGKTLALGPMRFA
ncbi:hypothetical protein PLESTB_001400500 [Pleodorina starrii]|uniref:Uncharacterized protein n=1 Tax=Pleodorina starrii TaxID=330485 RepID=A0A9W6BUM5_9CHLO|nr:hypothetical protein PLESTB_001400500 [Pleodorina starrii]GLC68715.1 hypothetical protein PLESTF_000727500 [Pleodorina starrii]